LRLKVAGAAALLAKIREEEQRLCQTLFGRAE
jgi:hypothetical protein